MTTKDDIISAIKEAADADGTVKVRLLLGTEGELIKDDSGRFRSTGEAWTDYPAIYPVLIEGLADYLDTHGSSTPSLSSVLAVGNAANAKITNLTTPTNDSDAATKKYVDDHSGGSGHDPVTITGNGLLLSGQELSLDFGTGATKVAVGNHNHTGVYDVFGSATSAVSAHELAYDHTQIHEAATVNGNGIAISGQEISLSIGTGATQVAAGNHTHSAQTLQSAYNAGQSIAVSSSGPVAISVADGINKSALSLTSLDSTNDPAVLSISKNSGHTGYDIWFTGAGNHKVYSDTAFEIASVAAITIDGLTTTIEGIEFPSVFEISAGPTGFANRTSSTWSFTGSTLTIAPVLSSYDIWFSGVKHTISISKNISITNVEGIHLIYFDTDDTLKEYVNPTVGNMLVAIRDKVTVGLVYWDATNNAAVYVGEERHGCIMDGITHYYLHYTRGLQYVSGLGLGDFVIGDASLDSHAQFSIEEGSVADEDIGITSSAISSTVGLPILYRNGANGDWRTVTQAGFSCYQNSSGTTHRLMYNQFSGGSWTTTEIGEGNYVLYHIFVSTGKTLQVYSVMGQNEYTTAPAARNGAQDEIGSLLTGNLPSAEMRPIATVIFQTDKDYGNSINARIIEAVAGIDDYIDWRTNDLPRGTVPGDHGNLTGLSDDDHSQYLLLAGRSGGQTVIGGTGTTDDLVLRATSGVGASGSDIIFQVGNNGATEAARFLYDGRLGIGTAVPDTSALVHLVSTSKVFVPPCMTTAQRTAISTPVEGGLVYDTDEDSLYEVQNGSWAAVGSGGPAGGAELVNLTGASKHTTASAATGGGTAQNHIHITITNGVVCGLRVKANSNTVNSDIEFFSDSGRTKRLYWAQARDCYNDPYHADYTPWCVPQFSGALTNDELYYTITNYGANASTYDIEMVLLGEA